MSFGGSVNYIEIVKCAEIVDSVGIEKLFELINHIGIVIVVWIIGE